MQGNKKILVAPLNWGLGHASRCIPIIKQLLNNGHEVFIASSGSALFLLKREFPQLEFFELEDYEPEYPESGSMVLKMATQLPKFLATITKEKSQLEKIVNKKNIDVVLSDNRYGCYSSQVKSIMLTHQLHLLMPTAWKWMEGMVNRYNFKQLKKFSEVWVPAPVNSFIPDLVKHKSQLKVRHIGYLSRLEKSVHEKKYDVCVICSGPEPQRKIFEKMVTAQLKSSGLKTILIKGTTDSLNKYYNNDKTFRIANYLTSTDMSEVIQQSGIIISRPGYSTVMDLARLGSKAIFIPTPGQTEQEFLAKTLTEQRIAYSIKQSHFDLLKALKEAENYKGFSNFELNESLLQNAIDSL